MADVIDISTKTASLAPPSPEDVRSFIRTIEYLQSLSWLSEGKITFDEETIEFSITRMLEEFPISDSSFKSTLLSQGFDVDFSNEQDMVADILNGFEELKECED